MTEKFRVQFLNHISANGLKRFPWDQFVVSPDGHEPHAILLRSADLHGTQIPSTVLAIGRAGSGTNNIPVAEMSARGIPVFNAPGANANAVKELVLAGMLLAARNLDAALKFIEA
ncbi:MAG TPA: 3-phosphoglycerate dehydrogenase, partial [Propionibacteriaceae bacterium]|nr:3-phosphoglycerate dehydrogenase [Propionibacteriaceae bacterium]